jgi:geranylgeranyl diphosphate synthase type I
LRISKNRQLSDEELIRAIEERSGPILERFRSAAVTEVTDRGLLAILSNITDNWKEPLRPALTSFSCEAVGGAFEQAVDAGAMFALASAGFGVHDDIVDKSSKKHFRRTVPALFGINGAILVGDLLMLKASRILAEITQQKQTTDKIGIIKAYNACYIEVCESEVLSLSLIRNLDVDLETCENILWKSAADMEACAKIGALIGEGSKQEVAALAEVGRRIGFYQRLLDDVKDTLNLEGNLPDRLKNERIPLPIVFAAKTSPLRLDKISAILQMPKIADGEARDVLEICFEANAFAHIGDLAEKNLRQIDQKLISLKPTFAQKALSLINSKSFEELSRLCI